MVKSILGLDLQSQFVLANALPVPVMIADAGGDVIFFNRAWYAFTGQPEGLPGEWGRYLHPDDLDRVATEWAEVIASGADSFGTQHRLREAATGTHRWFKTQATALRDESGQIVRWIGVALDIDPERRALDESTYVADKLQELYTPSALPLTAAARFSGWYQYSKDGVRVGGDWYRADKMGDDQVVFSVGDVTGHGVEAAVTMARARQAIMTVAANGDGPGVILRLANNAMLLEGDLVTCVVGSLRITDCEIRYSIAGHPPPVFVQPDGTAQLLRNGDLPLGLEANVDFRECVLRPDPGSLLVLYTDGLTEFDRDPIEGEKRVLRAAASLRGYAGPNLAQRLAEHVVTDAHCPDDIAVLCISFGANGQ